MRGRSGAATSQVQGLIVFFLGLALTTGALALLPATASRPVELLVLVLANALATVLRFVAFRSWIFAATSERFPLPRRPRPLDPDRPAPPPPATPPGAARRDRLAFAGLLVATAALYLVNLSANGWGNDFYAAAVQSVTKSWEAFFFGSFDAGNVVTVDKPPAALWVMALSARVFGLSSGASWCHRR